MNKKVVKFEDLNAWQESMDLAESVFILTDTFKHFSLKDQAQRSAVSIPSNIAEGFERGKHSNKEFIRFLYISLGSCSELRTQLYLAQRIYKIKQMEIERYIENSKKISAMLYKLIQTRINNF